MPHAKELGITAVGFLGYVGSEAVHAPLWLTELVSALTAIHVTTCIIRAAYHFSAWLKNKR